MVWPPIVQLCIQLAHAVVLVWHRHHTPSMRGQALPVMVDLPFSETPATEVV